VNWDTIENFIKDKGEAYKEKYKPFWEFAKALKDGINIVGGHAFPNNFVGTTKEKIFEKDIIYEKVCERLNSKSPCSSYIRDAWTHEVTRLVCFELFSSSEETLIHEVNHSITRDREFEFVSEDWMYGGNVEKIGLMVDDDDEIVQDGLLEELINDKASIEIAKIFKRRGGDLSSFLIGGVYMSSYELNHYMIEEFFKIFEEYLKEARISENKNEIVKRVGKENYALFCQFINRYYVVKDTPYPVDNYPDEEYKEKVLERISSLVSLMKEFVATSRDFTKEELEEYYDYLRSQGHNVVILNEPNSSGEKKK
ncbi:MAG: hypothetical protein K2I70_01730, partial [Bacilli bacterium]|nr:hypothetical protein [Bacilli bacterium]